MEIYVDTNLFLECRALETLPWEDLLEGDDDLVLVLTDPVVSEIDEKKGAGASRLRKAARRALSLIDAVEDADEVVIREADPRVVLRYDAGRPLRDDRMEEARNDHRLVGIAAVRAAMAEVSVAVLSGDRGVRLKAKALGLARLGIPDGWRRAEAPTEDEARIRELEAEARRLRAREPSISLGLDDPSGPPARFEMPLYPPLTGDEVDALMEELRSRHPMETVFDRKRDDLVERNSAMIAMKTFRPPSAEKIEDYREAYGDWVYASEDRFRELHERLESHRTDFAIAVRLRNDGTRPAEDLTIDFSARGHLGVRCADKVEETVDTLLTPPPRAPRGRWINGLGLIDPGQFSVAPSYLRGLDGGPPPRREDDQFYYRSASGGDFAKGYGLTCRLFRHGSDPEVFGVQVAAGTPPRIGETVSGAVEVAVAASNLSDPVRLTVPVEFLGVEGDTMAEARRVIEAIGAEN